MLAYDFNITAYKQDLFVFFPLLAGIELDSRNAELQKMLSFDHLIEYLVEVRKVAGEI